MTDLLVLLPFPLHPVTRGNRARARWLCDDLRAMGLRLHGLLHMREDGGRVPEAMLRWHARHFETFHMVPLTLAPDRALPGGPGAPDPAALRDPALSTYLPALFRAQSFDAVLAFGLVFAPELEHVPAGTLRVLEAGDPTWPAEGGAPPEALAAALARADVLVTAREASAAAFRRITDRPVLTVGLRPPAAARVARRPRSGALRCAYIGARSAASRRTVEALARALARRPHLRGTVEVSVLGGAAAFVDPALRALAGPALRTGDGRDDLAAVYAATDAILAPSEANPGVKIATIEALGTGLPVIATADGMDGLGATHPAHLCADAGAVLDRAEAYATGREDLGALAQAGQALLARYRVACAEAVSGLVRAVARPRLVLDPGEGDLAGAVWLVAAAGALGRAFDLALLGPEEALSSRLALAVALRAGALAATEAAGAEDLVWTADPLRAQGAAGLILPAPRSPDALRHLRRAAEGRNALHVVRSPDQLLLLEEGGGAAPNAVLALPVETGRPAGRGLRLALLLDGRPEGAVRRWLARFEHALETGIGGVPDVLVVHEAPETVPPRPGRRTLDPLRFLLRPPAARTVLLDAGVPGADEWDLRAWAYTVPGTVLLLDGRMKVEFARRLNGRALRPLRAASPEVAARLILRAAAAHPDDDALRAALVPQRPEGLGAVEALVAAARRLPLADPGREGGRAAA